MQNIQNDEIDLIELILSIWRKKWWVILVTIFFSTGSVIYALQAKEQWTSKAEIVAPRNYVITNILQERRQYARITDTEVGDVGGMLFDLFMAKLRSTNSRISFFEQSELYKKMPQISEPGEKKQAVLRNLVNANITIQWPNKKNAIDYLTVAFSAETPEDAQKTLAAYVDYLNQSALALSDKNFLITLRGHIDDLKFSLQRLEERLPLKRSIRLETQKKNLERALSTAQAAGIKEFSKIKTGEEAVISQLTLGEADIKLSDDELSNNNFLFLMGEQYLQAQIDNVEKVPLIFPEGYHHKKMQLQQLEALLLKHKINTSDQSFYYQSEPDFPIKRDKPKRALIVLIGTFLGGVIGLLVALFMTALDNRKIREQQVKA